MDTRNRYVSLTRLDVQNMNFEALVLKHISLSDTENEIKKTLFGIQESCKLGLTPSGMTTNQCISVIVDLRTNLSFIENDIKMIISTVQTKISAGDKNAKLEFLNSSLRNNSEIGKTIINSYITSINNLRRGGKRITRRSKHNNSYKRKQKTNKRKPMIRSKRNLL